MVIYVALGTRGSIKSLYIETIALSGKARIVKRISLSYPLKIATAVSLPRIKLPVGFSIGVVIDTYNEFFS
jgi:hypothetical protein